MSVSVQQNHPSLVASCERAIAEFRMLEPGDAVLVGVSGGPDSVALLHVLELLARRYEYRIGIAHLNHGLRGPAADQDAEFVENLAKKLALPYYLQKIDLVADCRHTGAGMEEAGREARYAFFYRIADRWGFEKIAVGHHMEDDAELILMNLLRGSGLLGISGIPPVRDRVIRPLIHASRREVMQYIQSQRIEFVQDQTNEDTSFRRNHIRHCLLPALRSYNPQVIETITRLGKVLRSEDQWIETQIEPLMEQVLIRRTSREYVLDGNMLKRLAVAPLRRIIRRAILELKGDLRRIGFSHIDAAANLLNNRRPVASLDLPDRMRIRLNDGCLIVSREKDSLRSAGSSGRQKSPRPFEYRITRHAAKSVSQWIEPVGGWLVLTRIPREALDALPAYCAAAADWDRIEFPLEIRNRRAGDRFHPLGMNGTQKLKDFFINNKIPEPQRDRIPLVVSGGQVVWVAGFRIDERVKITDATRSVLKMEFIPATGKYITHMRAEGF